MRIYAPSRMQEPVVSLRIFIAPKSATLVKAFVANVVRRGVRSGSKTPVLFQLGITASDSFLLFQLP